MLLGPVPIRASPGPDQVLANPSPHPHPHHHPHPRLANPIPNPNPSPNPNQVLGLVAGLGETLLGAVMALGLASDCAALRPFADPLETSARRPPPPHVDSDDEDIGGLVAALLEQEEPLTPRAVGRAAARLVEAGRTSPARDIGEI